MWPFCDHRGYCYDFFVIFLKMNRTTKSAPTHPENRSTFTDPKFQTDTLSGIMPIRPTRKAQSFARFSCVAHPIGQVEPLDGAGVGFRPAQVGHDLGQFDLAKGRSDFHLFNPPPLPMFDNLGIHQRLGDPHHRSRWSAAGTSTRHGIGSTKGRYNPSR